MLVVLLLLVYFTYITNIKPSKEKDAKLSWIYTSKRNNQFYFQNSAIYYKSILLLV
uniref:Uncharacterized protein n=1 Tax=Siphoviridae sp. ctREU2 TaxID=2826333 RepID=A0A8S5NKH3_9CAUD|nr:MAG TPA: hypothetical protein [Siphoviridae sp. ctREU2]